MNERILLVKGCAGLGNRLFTICNAIEYCLQTNRKICIDWSDGQFAPKDVNAFTIFFELEKIDRIIDFNEIKNITNFTCYPKIWKEIINNGVYDSFVVSEINHFNSIFFKAIPKGRARMLKRYWQYVENSNIVKRAKNNWHFAGLFNQRNFPFGSDLPNRLKEDIVVFADFLPRYSTSLFLNHIKLKGKYKDKLDEFARNKELFKNSIGVHVRSTDKVPTRSLGILFKKIDDISAKNPKIFLATDNKYVIGEFEKRFQTLITYPKFLPENNEEGLHQYALYNNRHDISLKLFEESIADMWLLSKCEYLLYQGNSSFSMVSKILHKDSNKTHDWLI